MVPKGVFGDTCHTPKGSERGFWGWRVPKGFSKEFPRGFSRRAALVVGLEIDSSDLNGEFGPSETLGVTLAVGFKIYGSGWSASSDRPNRLAVRGRPIGDQRRGCVGRLLSLLSGGTARAVMVASDSEAHRRRDLLMGMARHLVKRTRGSSRI